MKTISTIGSLLKRLYRHYSNELIKGLQDRGFTDLRPSFLEVLIVICEREGASIKEIGLECGLKKQTMTSHLNELERRDYISRRINPKDKREQNIHLTTMGEKFKLALMETLEEVEASYVARVGSVELERTQFVLKNLMQQVMEEEI